MSTPEHKVKQKAVKALRDINAYYFFPVGGGYGRAGIPDIIGCYNGKFFGIECKAGTNKPTALQMREMGAIEDSGGKTLVVNEDNVAMVASWVTTL